MSRPAGDLVSIRSVTLSKTAPAFLICVRMCNRSLNERGSRSSFQTTNVSLYGLDQQLALYKLTLIANRKQMAFKDYLIDLGRFVPAFSHHILEEIG